MADPKIGKNHNRGAAVDLTLVTLDGAAVEMPTPFDAFSPRGAPREQRGGRRGPRSTARRSARRWRRPGFKRNRMEWWHYDAPERRGAPLLDVPLVPAP